MTVLDLTNNRASSFRPDERLCSSVMLRDERADCALEFTHRTERAAPYALRRDFGEESFYCIQPGRTGRREVNVVPWAARKPSSYRGVFVRRVVVHDQVDVEFRRHLLVDAFEELKKLSMPVTGQALLDDFSIESVERSEERRGSVADVVVRLARRYTRAKRKNRCCSLQGLHAAFLIDAQNDRVRRRIHVKPNDITQLFDKFRIVAELEALHAVRLQVVGAQDRLNRRAADAKPLGQIARTPVSRVFRRRLHDGFRNRRNRLGADHLRPPRARRVGKDTCHAVFLKAPPYLDDILTRDARAPRNLRVGEPVSRSKNDLCAKNRTLRTRRASCQLYQRQSYLRAYAQAFSSVIRHVVIISLNRFKRNANNRSGH